MRRTWLPALLVLAAVVGVSAVGVPAATERVGSVEMQEGTETTSPTETTTTPADGPAGHADDPFPSWLPLLFAAGSDHSWRR